MKGLAVLILRYTEPGPREFRVPLNLTIAGIEIPTGLGLITLVLLATAVVNLLTKQVATIAGIFFTVVFYSIFTVSEKITRGRATGHLDLDQFHLAPAEDLSPQAVGARPGNILVPVRDYNTLYNLASVLARVVTRRQDVVVLHVRVLARAGSGEHGLAPEQLVGATEQQLFTRSLSLAEKNGKTVHLAIVAATDVWDAILRAAQSLQSSTVVLGLSPKMLVDEQARQAGAAWERLFPPRPHLTLEIHAPGGQEDIFYLGPHAPRLTPKEIDELHRLWLRFSERVGADVHHHDIVHFALEELQKELAEGKEEELLARLRQHLAEIKPRRAAHL